MSKPHTCYFCQFWTDGEDGYGSCGWKPVGPLPFWAEDVELVERHDQDAYTHFDRGLDCLTWEAAA